MGDRHARIGRHGDRRGDPGHDLVGDAGLAQRLRLLAAAAEDERVAALEAHDERARAAVLDQRLRRLVLGQRDVARLLARIDQEALRPARGRAARPPPGGRRRSRRRAAGAPAPRTVISRGSPGPAPTR